jgi:zinc/manganese transport system ATP-binding protein
MLHPAPHLPGAGGATVDFVELTAGYGAEPAVEGVTFRVEPGDFVGVVGPSGSGKTTLLRAILGDLRIYSGHVIVNGHRAGSGKQRVGYVPQLETVDWNFPVTAREVVEMGVTSRRLWLPRPGRAERARVREIMERLGIGELANRHIRQLSGGQQQRVFIGRALAAEPDLLLLDEPTSGVDIRTRDDVLHLLDELNHQGMTVILTTHELNAVAAHLPRVACINRRLVAEGSPRDVFTSGTLEATYGVAMPVVDYQGLRLVAERPHLIGHRAHPAGVDGVASPPDVHGEPVPVEQRGGARHA